MDLTAIQVVLSRLNAHCSVSDPLVKEARKQFAALEESQQQQTNADQLRVELSMLATDLECHLYGQFTEQMYRELRKRLRDLSAKIK